MGSSKIVLVGATSLIVGIYSLSIKKVESSYVANSINSGRIVQADRMIEAGLRLALNDLAKGRVWRRGRSVAGKKTLGGSVDYNIAGSSRSGNASIFVRVNLNGFKKNVRATAQVMSGKIPRGFKQIHRGQWVITKYYTQKEG